MPAQVEKEISFRYSGKRRKPIKKVCACGCGETFKTTFPDKQYVDGAHKQKAYRTLRHAR